MFPATRLDFCLETRFDSPILFHFKTYHFVKKSHTQNRRRLWNDTTRCHQQQQSGPVQVPLVWPSVCVPFHSKSQWFRLSLLLGRHCKTEKVGPLRRRTCGRLLLINERSRWCREMPPTANREPRTANLKTASAWIEGINSTFRSQVRYDSMNQSWKEIPRLGTTFALVSCLLVFNLSCLLVI
jgi:hypothetical protein